jgi:hypothetical protein
MNKNTIVQTNLAFMPECKYDWEILKKLWGTLKEDPGFFIFFEGTYIQLRCSSRNTAKVLDWSAKHKIQINGFEDWVEPWEHTKKHQDWYQKLFHLYTEAMFMFDSPEDLKQAVDRVCHCFLNTQMRHVNTIAKGKSNIEKALGEATIVAVTALERALTVGWVGREAHDKKEAKEK